ncbi:MAG: SDR family oxidoreductase [Solirubrobacteraceae bacterium]
MAVRSDSERVPARGGRSLPGAAVVLGARNLGAAIARDLLEHEVRVASIARTQADVDLLGAAGAVPITADASDPDRLKEALEDASNRIGPAELIVNAVSVRPPPDGSEFGGGAIALAGMAGFEGWCVPAVRQSFVFLSEGARALEGRGGTLVEIVGAPARRAHPKRGLVAAAQAAIRAMTHAAALELRGAGIHVALLIVDGIIESPKTARMTLGMDGRALARQEDIAEAVRYLATQSARGMSHELVITPAGDRWVP